MATEKQRETYLKKTYGLSPSTYAAMYKHTNGRCYVCDRAPKTGKNHAIDHDHHSLQIRGIVCYLCNKYIIGRKRKEHEWLFVRAAAYLHANGHYGAVNFGLVPKDVKRKRKRKG